MAQPFAAVADLAEFSIEQQRAKLRCRHPDLDGIEPFLAKWVLTRPGAEHGDIEGRP